MGAMKTINGSRRLRSARTDAAHRTQIVAAFERSGLSATAFARQQRLKYTTFCHWRQRQREAKSVPAFVRVEGRAAHAQQPARLHPGAVQLRHFAGVSGKR